MSISEVAMETPTTANSAIASRFDSMVSFPLYDCATPGAWWIGSFVRQRSRSVPLMVAGPPMVAMPIRPDRLRYRRRQSRPPEVIPTKGATPTARGGSSAWPRGCAAGARPLSNRSRPPADHAGPAAVAGPRVPSSTEMLPRSSCSNQRRRSAPMRSSPVPWVPPSIPSGRAGRASLIPSVVVHTAGRPPRFQDHSRAGGRSAPQTSNRLPPYTFECHGHPDGSSHVTGGG